MSVCCGWNQPPAPLSAPTNGHPVAWPWPNPASNSARGCGSVHLEDTPLLGPRLGGPLPWTGCHRGCTWVLDSSPALRPRFCHWPGPGLEGLPQRLLCKTGRHSSQGTAGGQRGCTRQSPVALGTARVHMSVTCSPGPRQAGFAGPAWGPRSRLSSRLPGDGPRRAASPPRQHRGQRSGVAWTTPAQACAPGSPRTVGSSP